MYKLFNIGGKYRYCKAKKVGEFLDTSGEFWRGDRVSVWETSNSAWRRFENESRQARAKFRDSNTWNMFEIKKPSDYFTCFNGEHYSFGEIVSRIFEPVKYDNQGYWVAHDGDDFVIFRLYDAWGHYDSAKFAMQYHCIQSVDDYDDFIACGITRVFTSSTAIMVTAPEDNLNDILYFLAISPKFNGYRIELVSKNFDAYGRRERKDFGAIRTWGDLMQHYE